MFSFVCSYRRVNSFKLFHNIGPYLHLACIIPRTVISVVTAIFCTQFDPVFRVGRNRREHVFPFWQDVGDAHNGKNLVVFVYPAAAFPAPSCHFLYPVCKPHFQFITLGLFFCKLFALFVAHRLDPGFRGRFFSSEAQFLLSELL